jgi:hypothetical protein
MIFDSEQQKNFILDCVRKYPTNYETALNLAQAFGQSIQDGRIIDIKEQVAKFPLPKAPKIPAEVVKTGKAKVGSDNGNSGQEETAKAAK